LIEITEAFFVMKHSRVSTVKIRIKLSKLSQIKIEENKNV